MERFGLAGLLAVLLPSLAAAQRVEVVAFAGAYSPLTRTQRSGDISICVNDPCPYFYRGVTRAMGLAGGARVTAQLSPRLAFDGTVQRASATHRVSTNGWNSIPERLTLTYVAVQPRVRLHVDDRVEGFLAAGPALVLVDAVPGHPGASATQSGTELGLAFSAGLRVPIAGVLALELRANDYVYTAHAPEPQMQHDLTYGLGLALASGSRAAPAALGQGPGWLARVAARTRLTPVVGRHVSLARHSQWTMPDAPGPKMGETHRLGLEPGVSAGVKAVFHGDRWLGVEASVTTASLLRRDDVSLSPAVAFSEPPPLTPLLAGARATVGTVRLLARKRVGSRGDVAIGIGPALIKVSTDALDWDRFGEPSQRSVWGASTSAALGVEPVRGVRGELSFAHHTYVVRYNSGHHSVATTTARQHDVVIAAGLGLALGR